MTSDSQLMDSRDVDSMEENENAKEDVAEQWEKGYDLPIDEPERKEAEDECKMILELISDIYTQADKGEAVNTVLDDKTIYKVQDRIKEKGYPVITMKAYAAMENYKKVEDFLKNCQEEKAGFIVLYELQSDGGIGRDKFIFDINVMLAVCEKNKYLLIMSFLMNLFCHILKIEVRKKNSCHMQ